MAGILLLTSARMGTYMNNNLPGIHVPQDLIDEMAGAEKGQALQKGIEITARLIRQLREENICDGAHIMAIGREHLVSEILSAAGF